MCGQQTNLGPSNAPERPDADVEILDTAAVEDRTITEERGALLEKGAMIADELEPRSARRSSSISFVATESLNQLPEGLSDFIPIVAARDTAGMRPQLRPSARVVE